MIEYIKENIGWLKDVFTLLFAGTGTIVAILTYRRARATVLQPIRTEVIKKQSETLSRFIQIIKNYNYSFEEGLDYINLVQTNVIMTLTDYGFVFKEHKELSEKIQNNIISMLTLLMVGGVCQKSTAQKVQKTYYYACYYENESTKKAWVTPVKSVTIYLRGTEHLSEISVFKQWEEYLQAEVSGLGRNTSYTTWSVVIKEDDEDKVIETIRQKSADYRKKDFEVITMRYFNYRPSASEKSSNN